MRDDDMDLKTIRKYIADIFLPNRCPACSRLIPWNKLICDKCKSSLQPVTGEPCDDLTRRSFDSCFSLFYYEQPCIKAVYALKHDKAVNFAEYGAQLLCSKLKKSGLADKADIVTCVPMSRKKLRKRKYNQAEMIAKYLADQLGKPLDASLLVHSPTLTEHHKLSKGERALDAQKSYAASASHGDITGKNVILCDDVYTTGATMDACARCLKDMGANSVIAVSIAAARLTERHYEDS